MKNRKASFCICLIKTDYISVRQRTGSNQLFLSKIFNRFYRVDKARSRAAGGTGLGLSIVQDMAKQHGGAVSVSRREPEGSCFMVRFPAWQKGGEEL